MRKGRLYYLRKTLVALGILVGLFVSVFPVLWQMVTSLRPTVDTFSYRLNVIPKRLTVAHYLTVFNRIQLGRYLANTVVVSLAVTFVVLIVGTLAAYALIRMNFRGRNVVLALFLGARLLPIITALVPLFIFVSKLKLLDTFAALILIHVAFKLPVTIWLMQGFIAAVPYELEEAAFLDGCNTRQVLSRVIFPLVLPGLAASGIIAFLFTWNDLIIALVLSSTIRTQPMSVGLTNFFLEHGIDWGPMSAAAVIMLVPAFVFAFFAQRYLIQGLTAGAVKG